MTKKKYCLTGEKDAMGLRRIQALRGIPRWGVKRGDLGGWVQKEANLSHEGDCWVYPSAIVYSEARIFGNALIDGRAQVNGRARVGGTARVSDEARIGSRARILGSAMVFGKARVAGSARVFGCARVGGNVWLYGDVEVCGDAKFSTGSACQGRIGGSNEEKMTKTAAVDEGVVPTEALYKGWRRAQFVKALANAQVQGRRMEHTIQTLQDELTRVHGMRTTEQAQARAAQGELETKARVHELAAQRWKVRAKDLERYVEQFRWALFELQSFLVSYKRLSAALHIRWGYYEKLISDLLRLSSPANEFSHYPAPDEGEGQ